MDDIVAGMVGALAMLGIMVLAILLFHGLTVVLLDSGPELPICQEDQVIIGVGQFDAVGSQGGQWEFYACGPAVDSFILE